MKSVTPRAFLEADPEGRHFHSFNWHFSGYDRHKHDAGICTYIPLNLGEVPDYYRRFQLMVSAHVTDVNVARERRAG